MKADEDRPRKSVFPQASFGFDLSVPSSSKRYLEKMSEPELQPGCLLRQAVQLSVSDTLSPHLSVPICEREVAGGGSWTLWWTSNRK